MAGTARLVACPVAGGVEVVRARRDRVGHRDHVGVGLGPGIGDGDLVDALAAFLAEGRPGLVETQVERTARDAHRVAGLVIAGIAVADQADGVREEAPAQRVVDDAGLRHSVIVLIGADGILGGGVGEAVDLRLVEIA